MEPIRIPSRVKAGLAGSGIVTRVGLDSVSGFAGAAGRRGPRRGSHAVLNPSGAVWIDSLSQARAFRKAISIGTRCAAHGHERIAAGAARDGPRKARGGRAAELIEARPAILTSLASLSVCGAGGAVVVPRIHSLARAPNAGRAVPIRRPATLAGNNPQRAVLVAENCVGNI